MWVQLAVIVVAAVLAWMLAPKSKESKPSALDDFDAPVAEEGIPVRVVFGKVWVTAPNVVWYGDLKSKSKKRDGVEGYFDYYLGMHMVACHGPVTAVKRIRAGDDIIWEGDITSSQKVNIHAPKVWGGTAEGGGVKGDVDFMFGESTQGVNDYLAGVLEAPVPAFRGVLSFVLRRIYISSNNTTLHPWAFEVYDLTGGGSTPWYTEKQALPQDTMNPMHIVYYCLTNTEWGMGYPRARMDDTQMRATADTLYDEGFGLRLKWAQEDSIANFCQIVVDHIGATFVVDPRTGKFQLKLIRADYDVASLPLIDENTGVALGSFQRTAWGETTNEIILNYTDEDTGVTKTLPGVQDYGNFQAQGGLVSSTRDYPGIVSDELAAKVALRDLKASASTLARVELTTNRTSWNLTEGDVFRFSWAKLGIANMALRVGSINVGSLVDGTIEIVAVEDVFGLPSTSYTGVQPSLWVDPVNLPEPATARKIIESPYWMLAQYQQAGILSWMPGGATWINAIATAPTPDASHFHSYSKTATSDFVLGTDGAFGTLATLVVPAVVETSSVLSVIGVTDLEFLEVGDICLIGSEIVKITALSVDFQEVTVSRGLMDTVPAEQDVGASLQNLWGYEAWSNYGYPANATVEVKLLTVTSKGSLELDEAPGDLIAAVGRQNLPLAPGSVKLNGVSYPATFSGEATLSWAHRDRLTQVYTPLTLQTEGNIGPEAGVTYNLYIYGEEGTLIRTEPGLVGTSYTYLEATEKADSGIPIGQELNLINPGAETGDMTGWTVNSGIISVGTNSGGGAIWPHSGSYFFAGGDVSGLGGFADMSSDLIDLVAEGLDIADIDAGTAWVTLDYWQLSYSAADPGRNGVRFLDAGSAVISEDFGAWLATTPQLVWIHRVRKSRVPVGTRYFQVLSEMELVAGSYVSVYLDDFILRYEVCPTIPLTIVNPGAADGTTDGWANETGGLAVKPVTGADGAPNHFYGGANLITVAVSTVIDLLASGAVTTDIDEERALVYLNYFVSAFETQTDASKVGVRFYDETDTLITENLDNYYTGPTYPAWEEKERTASIPELTRYIRLVIYMSRVTGTNNDGYVDELSLVYSACASGAFNSQLRFVLEAERDGFASFQAQDFTSDRV